MKLVRIILTLMVMCLCTQAALGDVQGDLSGFFDSLGFSGNVSKANAWEAQEAGYYSGGSLFLRNQVKNVQLVHLDLPSFRAGCGGIDAYLGGFSYLGDSLIDLSKQIMSNAAAYSFDLALETTVPEIKHVKDYLQGLEQKINDTNINSCETAEDLVGGVWPKARASQQQVCQDLGTNSGLFSDWSKARQGCTTDGDYDSVMQKAASDPEYKDSVIMNKNLVWDALKKQDFLADDSELAELVMSLTGTIIFDEKGDADEVASLIDSQSLTKALLHGGETTIWKCADTNACLSVSQGEITIDETEALVGQVSQTITELIDAVQNDTPLSDAQKGFVNSTSVPIVKFITVMSSDRLGIQAMDLTEYSEWIAEDLLEQYLSELLKAEKTALSGTSYTAELQQSLTLKIQEAQQFIAKQSVTTSQKLQDKMALIENMQFLEGSLAADLGSNLKPDLNTGDR